MIVLLAGIEIIGLSVQNPFNRDQFTANHWQEFLTEKYPSFLRMVLKHLKGKTCGKTGLIHFGGKISYYFDKTEE